MTLFLRNVMLVLTTIIVMSFTVHAQAKFKVLAVRGGVTVGKSAPAKLGQQVKIGDNIVVPKNGYISLAHMNGRTVELKKSGTYAVTDLDKAASKKSKSSTDKFAAYVLTELTEVNEPVTFGDTRRSNMRTTGSVERAMGDDVSAWDSLLNIVGAPGELQALAVVQSSAVAKGEVFSVIMPRHTRLLADTVRFEWHRTPKVTTFKVVVTDREDKAVHSVTVSDTFYTATTAAMNLKEGQLYYWHVENSADASYRTDEYALYRLTGEERVSSEQLIADVRSEYDSDEAAIGQLILGAAFEDMGLYYDAQRAYKSAVEMAPDIQNYKRMYADFLRRQGLNMEAYAAYR
jgi:hypothetical protein